MAKHSWLFFHKRGLHRTDSQSFGWWAELLFALFCILAGVAGTALVLLLFAVPEWKIYRHYERIRAEMLASRIVEHVSFRKRVPEGQKGVSLFHETEDDSADEEYPFQPDFDVADPPSDAAPDDTDTSEGLRLLEGIFDRLLVVTYQPQILVSYEHDGQKYQYWADTSMSVLAPKRYETREEAQAFIDDWCRSGCNCWLDPKTPGKAVIFRAWAWENYFSLFLPISFFLLGCGFLVHVLSAPRVGSRESSAYMAQGPPAPTQEAACLPSGEWITDSPGIRLAYRLPILDSPAWSLFVLVGVTLLWNVILVAMLTVVACSTPPEDFKWGWVVFAFPFAFVGGWLLLYTGKQLRANAAIGPTLVEIDRFPLHPGEAATVFLSQSGRPTMYWINVVLVCEEEVIFTHGTNTRHEKLRVFQRLVFGEEGVGSDAMQSETLDSGTFEVTFPLEIPSKAMHSFVTSRSCVNWKLLVQGAATGSIVFERYFPIVIYPAMPQEKTP